MWVRRRRRRTKNGVPISCSPPRSLCSSHAAAGEFPGQLPPLSKPSRGLEPAQGIPIANGTHPHPQISVPGRSPSLLPPSQLCSSPVRNFPWERKIHRLRTALMTQRFCWPRFLCRLPGEARGRPNLIPSHGNPAQPPAPASLPLVFPPLFCKEGGWVLDVRNGFAQGLGWGG